eukprot:gene1736-1933_t
MKCEIFVRNAKWEFAMHLKLFTDGWNEHPLRTEGNMSPIQKWIHGSALYNQTSDDISPDFGIDWNGPMSSGRYPGSEGHKGVQIPEIQTDLSEEEEQFLVSSIDPLDPSENFGCDIFFRAIQVLDQIHRGRATCKKTTFLTKHVVKENNRTS